MKEHLMNRMKELQAHLYARWITLAAREKQAVLGGGVLLGIFLIYFLIWSPINNRVDFLRESVSKNQRLLIWMKDADKQMRLLAPVSAKQTLTSSTALLGWLQKNVRAAELTKNLTQLKAGANDAIELQFHNVDFDKLIAWLMKAQSQQHFAITHMSIIKSQTAPLVQARVVVKVG